MTPNVGERVYAVESADATSVHLFGFGVYQGRQSPMAAEPDFTNPKIELDNDAGVVWGYQCWWAAESEWDRFLAGRAVVLVDVR